MLNLYQLQMFVTVAEAGSFSAAARRLQLTQPAVSMAVQALEKGLDGALFRRRGRRVELTPRGHQLLPLARQLLLLAAQAEGALAGSAAPVAGRLRLGSATTAGAGTVAARLGAFCAAHPQVQASLGAGDPASLLDALHLGDLDGVILSERLRGRTLEYLPLGVDEWVFVTPPDHPWHALAQAPDADESLPLSVPSIGPEDVRDRPLVALAADLRPGLNARRELLALLEERGVAGRDIQVGLEVPDAAAMLAAVGVGAGAGVVVSSALGSLPLGLTTFTLRGGPLLRPYWLARERRSPPTPPAAAWWAWCAAEAGGVGE